MPPCQSCSRGRYQRSSSWALAACVNVTSSAAAARSCAACVVRLFRSLFVSIIVLHEPSNPDATIDGFPLDRHHGSHGLNKSGIANSVSVHRQLLPISHTTRTAWGCRVREDRIVDPIQKSRSPAFPSWPTRRKASAHPLDCMRSSRAEESMQPDQARSVAVDLWLQSGGKASGDEWRLKGSFQQCSAW